MSAFKRLQKALENSDGDFIKVKRKDLRLAVKFLTYHRQWRLLDGHIVANNLKNDPKVAKRIDKNRVKYYAKFYNVNMKDIVHRVTKYMRDALHGGGNTEDHCNILEAYLYPEKYNAEHKTRDKSKNHKSGRRSTRVRTRGRRHRSSS